MTFLGQKCKQGHTSGPPLQILLNLGRCGKRRRHALNSDDEEFFQKKHIERHMLKDLIECVQKMLVKKIEASPSVSGLS